MVIEYSSIFMTWTNWKKELNELLNGEELVGVNIAGTLYRAKQVDDGLKRLSHGFDDGYGTIDGEPIWAWTKESVIICICYDGAESLIKIPRKPTKGDPSHYGGG